MPSSWPESPVIIHSLFFSISESPNALCDLARWVHLPSGRVYNDTYSAPKVAGHDDVTGEPLSKRPDDNPVSIAQAAPVTHSRPQETFSKRLEAFYESTAPLLDVSAAATALTSVLQESLPRFSVLDCGFYK
jgi:hypothetical protein